MTSATLPNGRRRQLPTARQQPQVSERVLVTPELNGFIVPFMFLIFLFLTISRFQEAVTVTIGFRSHLYTIALAAALPVVFGSGRWVLAWKSVPGKLLLFMTVWMVVGLPFSIWRGGAFNTIKDDWLTSLIAFMLAAGMILTLRDMRRSLYVFAFSMLIVALVYFRFERVDRGGRVGIEFGTLSNSNDLAGHLLMGLPLLVFVFMDQKRITFTRLLSLGTACAVLLIVFRTGSRGALLGLMALLVATFLFSSFAGKVKLLLGGIGLVLMLVGTAPQSVLNRYRTIWSDSQENEATASADGRKRLLEESLRQTMLHPLFGVGAGNFPVAWARKMEAAGATSHLYRAAHNSYTEVASETGIPGFACWFGALVWSFRHNLRVYRWARTVPGQQQLANMAICFFLSILAFAVTTFFGNNSYSFHVPLLAGLSVSMARVATQQQNVVRAQLHNRMPVRV